MKQLPLEKYHDLALLLLRIGVGVVFIVAGWGKMTGLYGALFTGTEWGFVGAVEGIGFPFPFFFAGVVAIVEFVGGLMVLTGLYAKIPNLLLAFVMIVALFGVKWDQGFGAMRVDILLLLMTLALAILGSGKYSINSILGKGEV